MNNVIILKDKNSVKISVNGICVKGILDYDIRTRIADEERKLELILKLDVDDLNVLKVLKNE